MIKSKLTHGLMMVKNHRTNRHIVVFESDDWGSIRMPSVSTLNRLSNKGVNTDDVGSLYDAVDTLASNDDLELLMDVLSSVKDSKGNYAKITLNCVTANPDFAKIRESGFLHYFYEPFTETLKKYPHHDKSFDLWKEGIADRVFMPQFHGREHLNVPKWMRLLQAGNSEMMVSFDEGVFSRLAIIDEKQVGVLAGFDVQKEEDIEYLSDSIADGLRLFEQLFGFVSKTMIAPCYTWDTFAENIANRYGVRGIQGGYTQKFSTLERLKGKRFIGHYFGERNNNNQVYLVRNCNFEPSQSKLMNSDQCLKEISNAFLQRIPAVVSCHRLNFIGDLVPANRDNNLRDYKKLLQMIVTKYPDVEFLSSDELLEMYDNN